MGTESDDEVLTEETLERNAVEELTGGATVVGTWATLETAELAGVLGRGTLSVGLATGVLDGTTLTEESGAAPLGLNWSKVRRWGPPQVSNSV